jgi:transposase
VEEQAAALRPDQIGARVVSQRELRDQTAEVPRPVEWCTRPLCGRKSERRLREPDPPQWSLSGLRTAPVPAADRPPPPTEPGNAYHRRVRYAATDLPDERGLRFAAAVPGQAIRLANPEVADLPPDASEVSGEKGTSRLAQRPGAYLILKDLRPVINHKETADLSGPPAPPAVFEKSFADVRGLAGLRIDKVAYPLPLYRQPQRLVQAGMRLSRGTLPQGVQRAAELLAPSSQAL